MEAASSALASVSNAGMDLGIPAVHLSRHYDPSTVMPAADDWTLTPTAACLAKKTKKDETKETRKDAKEEKPDDKRDKKNEEEGKCLPKKVDTQNFSTKVGWRLAGPSAKQLQQFITRFPTEFTRGAMQALVLPVDHRGRRPLARPRGQA